MFVFHYSKGVYCCYGLNSKGLSIVCYGRSRMEAIRKALLEV